MKRYAEVKYYANKLYADTEIFSPGEWVAERILYLLSHGHNVEGVVENLSARHSVEVQHGNTEEARCIQDALRFIGEENNTHARQETSSTQA